MIKNIIIGISILLVSIVGIYQFMTASRPFDLGIEINQKMNEIAIDNDLTVTSDQIDIAEINRPTIKKLEEQGRVPNTFICMTLLRWKSIRNNTKLIGGRG